MLLLDGDTQTKGAYLIEDSGLSSTSGTESKENGCALCVANRAPHKDWEDYGPELDNHQLASCDEEPSKSTRMIGKAIQ